MKCLFWNANRNNINDAILQLALENQINVLAIAEYNDDITELKKLFISHKLNYHYVVNLGSRVTIFTSYPPSNIKRIIDKKHYTLLQIRHFSFGSILFGFVHLFSKMMKNEDDYLSKITRMVQVIENKEEQLKSDFTVIAGDFNMNPFEKGMLAGGALFSFPTLFEAKKKKRTLDDEEYKMFYNPMWRFLGDDSLPGTYHTIPTHTYGLHWNIFDQVIYRPSLIDHISNVKIINEINQENLVDFSSIAPKIKFSDHLPIYFEIKGDIQND